MIVWWYKGRGHSQTVGGVKHVTEQHTCVHSGLVGEEGSDLDFSTKAEAPVQKVVGRPNEFP